MNKKIKILCVSLIVLIVLAFSVKWIFGKINTNENEKNIVSKSETINSILETVMIELRQRNDIMNLVISDINLNVDAKTQTVDIGMINIVDIQEENFYQIDIRGKNIKVFYMGKGDITEDRDKMKLKYFSDIMEHLEDIKEDAARLDFLCVKNIYSNPTGYETCSYFEYNESKINNLNGNMKKEPSLYDYGIQIFGMKADESEKYETHNKEFISDRYNSEEALMILADEMID